jgi:hypothetical protein
MFTSKITKIEVTPKQALFGNSFRIITTEDGHVIAFSLWSKEESLKIGDTISYYKKNGRTETVLEK